MKLLSAFLFTFLLLFSYGQTVSLDPTFIAGTGPNNSVIATAILPDGKIIVGGSFLVYDAMASNGAVRLKPDGSIDALFDPSFYFAQAFSISLLTTNEVVIGGGFLSSPGNIVKLDGGGAITGYATGTGFDGNVWATAIQTDQKIIVGGDFHNYNGTSRNGITRLQNSLMLDPIFNPGTGVDGSIMDIIVQPNQKILAAGNFTNYNGTSRSCIVLLNPDGTVDPSFITGTGFDNGIQAIALQSDGKIIVVGSFTSYNGTSRNRIARLYPSGALDNTFNPGTGFDNFITDVTIQQDGKILVAGDFTSFNGTPRNRIARLNSDGTLDTTFDPGSGFDAMVWSLATQTDGKIIVSGNFTSFDGTPRAYLARLDASASGIEEISSDCPGFHVYPNPTDGHFLISLDNQKAVTEFTVYDLQGKVVHAGTVFGKLTPVELDLDNGLYYLEVAGRVVKVEVRD